MDGALGTWQPVLFADGWVSTLGGLMSGALLIVLAIELVVGLVKSGSTADGPGGDV